MLQDLDSLAARIGQMVQFTRQLQSERSALQARLKSLDQEHGALRDQLQRRENDYAEIAQRLAQHESNTHTQQSEVQSQLATLQQEVVRYKAEADVRAQQLLASQADTARLRTVADQARENIDSILMRLPGATQE